MSVKPGGHLFADALALNGTRMVFTVPRNSVLGTLDGLREHAGVQVVVCRQQGGAAFMGGLAFINFLGNDLSLAAYHLFKFHCSA